MRNLPLIIAVAGGALVFFLWRQRQAQANALSPVAPSQFPARESVPQEWIESTPEGMTVIGTTSDPWDILT
ncbi:MAG: hypothetical protein GTN49_10855 [candidate division Zixibacteria bacterium]|nr:hypothetical protein [candidate division Zixibacteria bacterium]